MIKTLSNIFKQDKEKFVIPRSVQQVIPIETIWSDGIFIYIHQAHSCCYRDERKPH